MSHTDWLATLREQADIGKQMAQDVPLMLARPNVTLAEVRRVFGALDHQAPSSSNWQTSWRRKDTILPSLMRHEHWRIFLPSWRRLPPTRWFRCGDDFLLAWPPSKRAK